MAVGDRGYLQVHDHGWSHNACTALADAMDTTRGTLHLLKLFATLTLRADQLPLLPSKGAAKTLANFDIHITTV